VRLFDLYARQFSRPIFPVVCIQSTQTTDDGREFKLADSTGAAHVVGAGTELLGVYSERIESA